MLVRAMSNDAVAPVAVGALRAGVPAIVGGWRRQVRASISSAESARPSNSALSSAPANRRLLPSLPIRNGPAAAAIVPLPGHAPTSLPSM